VKLLILTLVLLPLCAHSQVTKCKYDVNEVDSFTGLRIIETKFFKIGDTEKRDISIQAAARKVDSTYFLFITGLPGQCISDHDTQVSFKTVTGEIYSLKHIGEVECGKTIYVGGASAQTTPTIYLKVDKQEIRQLAMSMIRITDGQTYTNVVLPLPIIFKQLFDCADSAPIARKK